MEKLSLQKTLKLGLRFAVMELKSGLKGHMFFVLSLFLGVLALTSINAILFSAKEGLSQSGKILIDGDLVIQTSTNPLHKKHIDYLQQIALAVSQKINMRVNLFEDSKDAPILIEVKAVDKHYPIAAEFIPLNPLKLLTKNQTKLINGKIHYPAIIDKEVELVENTFRIGEQYYYKIDNIIRESDILTRSIQLAPKVIISIESLNKTGLILPGSRVNYLYSLILDENEEIKDVIEKIKQEFGSVRFTYNDRDNPSENISEFIERTSNFYLLVNLTILMIAGVGIAIAINSYLYRKRGVIAVWKALGAPNNLIFSTYFLQISIIAITTIVIAISLGLFVPSLIAPIIQGLIPFDLITKVSLSTISNSFITSFLIFLLFTLMPLFSAENTRSIEIFRKEVKFDISRKQLAIVFVIGVITLGYIIFSSKSLLLSFYFSMSIIVIIVSYLVLSYLIIYFSDKFRTKFKSLIQISLGQLARNKFTVYTSCISLGVGLSLITSINLIKTNLTSSFENVSNSDKPNYFLIDIQSDQISYIKQLEKDHEKDIKLVTNPIVRMELVAINGVYKDDLPKSISEHWVFDGNRVVSWQKNPPDPKLNNITQGTWWTENEKEILVSFSDEEADELNLKIGDEITLNILSREITAKIKNFRKFDWNSFQLNFVMIFSPSIFDNLPQTYLASITSNNSSVADNDESLQSSDHFPSVITKIINSITKKFNNITVINVEDIYNEITKLVGVSLTSLNFVGIICLLVGAIVMAGQAFANFENLIYTNTIFKVSGASFRQILVINLLFYFLIGLMSAVIAAIISIISAFLVMSFLFNITMTVTLVSLLTPLVLGIVISILIGLVATNMSLKVKPITILRND